MGALYLIPIASKLSDKVQLNHFPKLDGLEVLLKGSPESSLVQAHVDKISGGTGGDPKNHMCSQTETHHASIGHKAPIKSRWKVSLKFLRPTEASADRFH